MAKPCLFAAMDSEILETYASWIALIFFSSGEGLRRLFVSIYKRTETLYSDLAHIMVVRGMYLNRWSQVFKPNEEITSLPI
jgi:hypothetical protein